MFAVTVSFTIRAGQMDRFLPLMLENARTSLTDERGCLQFDVCTDLDRSDAVFLYELYDDRAAFDAHLASAHFREVGAQASGLVAEKAVAMFSEVRQ